MRTPRDFSNLKATLLGISDRQLQLHLDVYAKHVEQLNAIESAYPLTDWTKPTGSGVGQVGEYARILDAPVAVLDLTPVGPIADCLAKVEQEFTKATGHKTPWVLYLGDGDFWTADQGRIVNVPWYLANPALWRLANRQKETAFTPEQVLRSLRHELGHVVNYVWRLWQFPEWTHVFGDFLTPYNDRFPSDERDVEQVEYLTAVSRHYPQKHPDEAWAEAFARWLDPKGGWEEEFKPWPKALDKLKFVDAVLNSIITRVQPQPTPLGRPTPYRSLKGTVRQHLGAPPGTTQFSPNGWSEHSALLKAEPAAHNAVVLHELYFEQLDHRGSAPTLGRLNDLVVQQWGSWESYLLDLRAICGSTSGWALTTLDYRTGRLKNALVEGHDRGVLADARIILAIDCHEHAYFADYGTRKDVYLGAVFANMNWAMVENRMCLAPSWPEVMREDIEAKYGEDVARELSRDLEARMNAKNDEEAARKYYDAGNVPESPQP